MQRQGNTLSTILRSAYDGKDLDPLTKNSKISASSPHICIVGHITEQELRTLLAQVHEAQARAAPDLDALYRQGETWEVR